MGNWFLFAVEETSEESASHHAVDPSKETRTVFISNLDYNKTEDEVREFFADVSPYFHLRNKFWFQTGKILHGYVFLIGKQYHPL